MAKKHAKNAPLLIPDAFVHAVSRYLPASVLPLFLPSKVREAARGLHIDRDQRDRAHEVFRAWAGKLRLGQLHGLSETTVHADFIGVLLKALGYGTQAGSTTEFNLYPEWHVPNVGPADVALGRFRFEPDGTVAGSPVVLGELKGAGTDLDKVAAKGRSPVGQAWDYLNATDGAAWALVSNYEEFRLYSRRMGTNRVHRVFLEDLEDADAFADFYAVFHHHALLGTGNFAQDADWILRETEAKQETVGQELYDLYRERRRDLYVLLRGRGVGRDEAIKAAQTLLDRVLFIAFAEDRNLLHTPDVLKRTGEQDVPMLSRWNNFQHLFRALDRGMPLKGIPRFNGELFKPHEILDDPEFDLPDDWPDLFATFGGFDFRNEVTVDVLGQIFERSIEDIEALRAEPAVGPEPARRRKQDGTSERRLRGVFYTDPAIVDYLVGAALQPAFDAARARLAAAHGVDLGAPATPPAAFTRGVLAALDGLTVCDPACGSGAFLNGAYNWFEDRRFALLKDLCDAEPDAPECAGDLEDWRERSAPKILRDNLYGVDLSYESVEIARLSLWIRTARRGQILAPLAENVVRGNSVVDDPAVDPLAFDWRARFPRVFGRGGFDAVVGNPPYVRQERLGASKPHFQANYRAYHGMADLYVYFYERGLSLLRPGGRLAYVVTNKWMKAGYGGPLRALFAGEAWVESVVDFGHAKKFFKEADVFPCFLVARKPADAPPPATVEVCAVPRELADLKQLPAVVGARSLRVERDRLGADAWQLEPQAVGDLMDKIRRNGVPLAEYAGVKPYYGIKTGFNEAFLIDTPTRDRLVRDDPRSAEVLRPYLRGQDIKRWSPEWAGLWMIFTRRGIDIDAYPAIKRHLEAYRARLEPMPKDWGGTKDEWSGRKEGHYNWFEIQDTVEYYDLFNSTKIYYQVIQFRPNFCIDRASLFGNDKTFFIPSDDFNLLAVLNSPLMWWRNWRVLTHMKDEALSPMGYMVEQFPVAERIRETSDEVERVASRLTVIASTLQTKAAEFLDWLVVQHEIAGPNTRLQAPVALTSDDFVKEVSKARGKKKGLSVAALKDLRDEFARTIEPAKGLAAEAAGLELRLHDLVNAAYGLTAEEVRLMWDTAPPRMPIPRPPGV